ncbi:putative sugar transporter protein 5, partial [Operophtera brumata]
MQYRSLQDGPPHRPMTLYQFPSCSRKDSIPFIKNGTQGVITKTVAPEKSGKAGRGKALRQVVASFVANLGTINTGMAFGFSATALPQLKSPESSIHITDSEASWIGRLLIGFGSGMVGAPARVYTCEVSQPHLRGMLGALASVGVSTGVLIQ